MVNFKKLASRAQVAKDAFDKQVEKQGGTEAVKAKADRIKTVAKGPGSVSDKAKAAADVAREKPNPASDVPGDSAQGPIGGGDAPPAPPVSERPAPAPDPDVPAAAAGEPVVDPDAPAGEPEPERSTDR